MVNVPETTHSRAIAYSMAGSEDDDDDDEDDDNFHVLPSEDVKPLLSATNPATNAMAYADNGYL